MARPLFIEIDGKRYAWKDIQELKRTQLIARAKAVQPTLFALVDDTRPASNRSATGRYTEPSLFSG